MSTIWIINNQLMNLKYISSHLKTHKFKKFSSMANAQHREARTKAILDFWFEDCNTPETFKSKIGGKWYKRDLALDNTIKNEFGDDVAAVREGRYDDWILYGKSALAAIICMDQFNRNINRDTAEMYALDDKASHFANSIIENGKIEELNCVEKLFVFMPFMHSEKLDDQNKCVKLFEALENETREKYGDCELLHMTKMKITYAIRHRNIVEKYGRFPHRNKILGRSSTQEEIKGLNDGTIESF